MFGWTAVVHSGERVDVWVVLTEPPVSASNAAGQLEKVKQQQDRVMKQLEALGATELARVTLANNAIAVSIDPSKVGDAKRIPGVRSVSRVQNIQREPRPPSQ